MADTDYTETTAPASSPPSLPYDPDPVTPTDPPASTPALASPTTPYHIQGMGGTEHLQTPAAPVVEGAKTADVGIGGKNGTGGARKRGLTIVDIGDLGPAEEGVGLGFGDVGVDELEMEDVYGNKSHPVSTGAAMGQLAQRRHLEAGASRSETPEADVGFPDAQALAKMQHRLDELEAGSQSADASPAITELSQMVKSLLNPATKQLPFLNEQIAAQRETIKTLQAQAKLSDKLVKIERERHAAERQSWRVTLNALTRQRETEIASGSRPKGLLDVDMGYHEELEAANKRLEMDNRLMGPRLADTQQQVDRLVAELRHLRSHVVLSTDPFTATAQETGAQLSMGQGGAPTTPILADPFTAPPTLPRSRSPIKPITGLNGLGLKGGSASMGDARTEHLLLAARKVRVMRLANPGVGQLTMDELKRNGIKGPDGGLGYKEGYPGAMDSAEEEVDELADDSDLDETPYGVGPPVRSQSRARAQAGDASKRRRASWSGKRQRGTTATPVARSRGGRNEEESLTAVANTRPRKPKAPVTPSSKRGPRQAPHTTPGGNFDDLLRAAELATRPTTPTRETGNSKGAGVLGHRASHSHSIGHPPMSLPAGAMSATRSTNRRARERSEEADRDGDGSPRKARRVGSVGRGAPEGQHGPGGWRTGHGPRVLSGGSTTSTSGGGEKSALDLLLQASQIESRNDEVRQSAQTATEGGAQVQQVGSGGLEPAFEFRDGELMVDSRSSSVPIGGDDDGTPRAAQPTSAAQGSSIGVDGPSGKGVGSMSRPSRPAPIDVQATAAGVAADHGGVAAQGSDRTRALRQGTPLVPVTQTQQYPSSSTAAGANVHTPARPWVRMPDSSPFDDTARLPAGARSANPGVLDPISYQMLQAQHQAQHSSPAQTQTQTPRTSVPNHGPVGQGTAGEGANGNGIGNGAAVAKTPVTKGGNGPPFDSPTGVAVPGLGKYAHLTSSMPARRVRSPYLKWTVEEDELLARAVAIHGEKWDLVSKGVPTRSYHQVRQRWLRKTGAFDKKGITPISTPATTPARPHILSNQPQHFDPVLTSDQMQTQNQGKTVAPSLINGVGSGMLGSASRRGSKESVGDDEELAEGAMQRSNSPTPAEGARAGKGRRGSLSLA